MPRSEITRFPHAVLEVKLSLPEGENAPDWVADLIESGFLTEVRGVYPKCTVLRAWPELLDSFSFLLTLDVHLRGLRRQEVRHECNRCQICSGEGLWMQSCPCGCCAAALLQTLAAAAAAVLEASDCCKTACAGQNIVGPL